MQQYMKKRNEHEAKVLIEGNNGFTKIFVKDKQQFEQYSRFYDFAEEIFSSQGSGTSHPYSNMSSYIGNSNNKTEALYKAYF